MACSVFLLLSSPNEVWVGHRNAGRLSFCPSVRLICECDILRTVSPIDFSFEICYQTTENTDAIDFGPCGKTKMAAIKLFDMYAIDTPCERDIFKTVLPIHFKFDF